MSLLIYGSIAVFFAYLICRVGEKRRIGFGYAFVLSLTLSPLIAYLIVLKSAPLKSYKAYQPTSESNRNTGFILIGLGLLIVIGAIYRWY